MNDEPRRDPTTEPGRAAGRPDAASDPATAPASDDGERPLLTAIVLAIGSELTVGETLDTNSRELARSLTAEGVVVVRTESLRDDLAEVVSGLRGALVDADLVVCTGGLGPTPDDLTREAIAELCGQQPRVDPALEAWLRDLFARRGATFPKQNLKQAWLVPCAEAIPNERGTAPGWLVSAPGGGTIVAMPGVPLEMRAMWQSVLPRLRDRGLGADVATTTLRLSGVGESHVAHRLGELLYTDNPTVATYARADAVDVRISARAEGSSPASDVLAAAEARVVAKVGRFVWGRGDETWVDALGRVLETKGWDVATAEVGTAGSLTTLLGEASWLRAATSIARPDAAPPVTSLAEDARRSGATIGLAIRADQTGADTIVEMAASGPWGLAEDTKTAFLVGPEGRRRAALSAALFLLEVARRDVDGEAVDRDAGTVSAENERRQRPEPAAEPAAAEEDR